MRVLERSRGLSRTSSGTLRKIHEHEPLKKHGRRPVLIVALLVLVVGGVGHVTIGARAVQGEATVPGPLDDDSTLPTKKAKAPATQTVVVRILTRRPGSHGSLGNSEDTASPAVALARRLRVSKARVELWQAFASSETRKDALKKEGIFVHELAAVPTAARAFLAMLEGPFFEDVYLLDGDAFTVDATSLKTKDLRKDLQTSLKDAGKLRMEGSNWWAQPLSMLALTNGALSGHSGGAWLQAFHISLDELEGVARGRNAATLALAGQLALREAWWRAPIKIGRELVATDFLVARRPLGKTTAGPPGPVQRALHDTRITSSKTAKKLKSAVDRERNMADQACPSTPRATGHGVVIVTGSDARTPHDSEHWDHPLSLQKLPKGVPKAHERDDIAAQLGGVKAHYARAWKYPFVFGVTSSIAAELEALGLKHFEFAKPFLLVAALHGKARSLVGTPRKGHWLAWLDHDVWPHPRYAYADTGSLDAQLDAVDPRASLALGNFRSLNTGVLFARLDVQGRRILHEWALTAASGVIECQPYDQAALQLVLLARLEAAEQKPPNLWDEPFGYTCTKAQGCGGSPEKPFGMCNPHYHRSVKKLLKGQGRCVEEGCDQKFDRGRANDVLVQAGFFTITEGQDRLRPQCFDAQRLDGCRTRPGANFPKEEGATKNWLFNHKGLDLFLRSRARGIALDAHACEGRAYRQGLGDDPAKGRKVLRKVKKPRKPKG